MKCKVQLIGRLGNEPDIRTTSNGKQVANLSIATEEYWKDRQGNAQRRTTWHNVKFWAEGTVGYIDRNIGKGTLVEIEGTIRYEEFTDRENVKHKVPVILGTSIMALQPLTKQHEGASESNDGPDYGEDQIPF
jgi:single-strand DNA-binding protein